MVRPLLGEFGETDGLLERGDFASDRLADTWDEEGSAHLAAPWPTDDASPPTAPWLSGGGGGGSGGGGENSGGGCGGGCAMEMSE
mmetsp:Transcript_35627/g.115496  ORF Transcript_35627/g.115496 Transcript_35627/m.115496 type:complete len:85 (+) Transcript_35627:83-337(+)